jgi:hypothetical protein
MQPTAARLLRAPATHPLGVHKEAALAHGRTLAKEVRKHRTPRYDPAPHARRSHPIPGRKFNADRLDDLVLALPWFNSTETEFGGHGAWKSLPWDVLDRLHARGLIGEPRRKSYSVTLDDEARERGRAVFEQWFVAANAPGLSIEATCRMA